VVLLTCGAACPPGRVARSSCDAVYRDPPGLAGEAVPEPVGLPRTHGASTRRCRGPPPRACLLSPGACVVRRCLLVFIPREPRLPAGPLSDGSTGTVLRPDRAHSSGRPAERLPLVVDPPPHRGAPERTGEGALLASYRAEARAPRAGRAAGGHRGRCSFCPAARGQAAACGAPRRDRPGGGGVDPRLGAVRSRGEAQHPGAERSTAAGVGGDPVCWSPVRGGPELLGGCGQSPPTHTQPTDSQGSFFIHAFANMQDLTITRFIVVYVFY